MSGQFAAGLIIGALGGALGMWLWVRRIQRQIDQELNDAMDTLTAEIAKVSDMLKRPTRF